MNLQSQAAVRMLKAGLSSVVLGAFLASCGGGHDDLMGNGGGMTPTITSTFATKTLVADQGTDAAHLDSHLVNAWGIAFNPTAFVWVANNGTSTSTLYDGNGVPQTLVVAIPSGTAGAAAPTGIVYNGTSDFKVTENGVTGASPFIFVGEAGTVSGWSPTVDRNNAVIAVDTGGNAVYKGLAIGAYNGANYLYAADFHNNRIDVYDANWQKATLPGNFADPNLPTGYAPFGIQAIGDRIYVAYAQRATIGDDDVKGAGLGMVDVYDMAGNMVKRLVTGGALNAPWGLAMAPANFGDFSNALLVGNFGDGKINAYNPTTGAFVGTLQKADHTPIVIDGLWGIAFGNGVQNQPTNTLFYTAGPGDEAHGVYGRIDMQ
jgi:uncharacterized protein (TIGR03118 family)